jgi:hypothetical protein
MLNRHNGDIWTYENLNAFIASPKTFTPGTKMSFPGIKDDRERANVLAYLSTLAPSPVPFPASSSEAPVDMPPVGEGVPAGSGNVPAASAEQMISPQGGVPADAASESQAPIAIEGGAAPVKPQRKPRAIPTCRARRRAVVLEDHGGAGCTGNPVSPVPLRVSRCSRRAHPVDQELPPGT